MASYSTPGVYIERPDAAVATINPLRTDIAGFVGLARRGPLDTPVPVESFRQFEASFGSFTGAGFLAYAVRGFFENGGRRCWVVRVASRYGARAAAAAATLVRAPSGRPRLRIAASSPGVWGNDLTLTLAAVAPARTVTVGPAGDAGPLRVTVASVAGFQRGDLLEITQPGLPAPLHRVLSFVDAGARRLYFVHPEPNAGLPYDRPLVGFDRNRPLQIASLAYTIAVRLGGRPLASFSSLALVPEHPRYAPLVLPAAAAGPSPPILVESLDASAADVVEALAVVQGRSQALADGADGLAELTVRDFLGEPFASEDSDEVKAQRRRGVRALDEVDEVAIVAVPDIVVQPMPAPSYAPPEQPRVDPCRTCPPPEPPVVSHQPTSADELPPRFSDEEIFQVQATLVELCEARRDRIALLDPPPSTLLAGALGLPTAFAWRARFDSRCAAFYYPWLEVVDPLGLPGGGLTRAVPASGHVAGQYAGVDNEIGVHRAPANRPLAWAEDVAVALDEAQHGELNELGINAVRATPGRGLRLLGARTLSSDPSWRYVNVRRLMMMIMKAIDIGTQWAVFEPNDAQTRAQLTLGLAEFLGALWQRGALVGPTATAAFVVCCDETNNPPAARADGRLLAEVAVAPSQPFEFVVLRVGRQGNAFEVEEPGRPAEGRP